MTFFFLIDLFILHDAVVNHWNVGKLQQQQQRRRKRLTTLKNLNRMTRECVEARSIAGETEHLIVWRDGKQISKNPTATKKKKNEDTIVSGARWIRRCLWAAVFFFFFSMCFVFVLILLAAYGFRCELNVFRRISSAISLGACLSACCVGSIIEARKGGKHLAPLDWIRK